MLVGGGWVLRFRFGTKIPLWNSNRELLPTNWFVYSNGNRYSECNQMGMASVSTSKLVAYSKPEALAFEFPTELSLRERVREQVVLFARRRMLDWKIQATRLVVVLGGSLLVFSAWKSLVTWLG